MHIHIYIHVDCYLFILILLLLLLLLDFAGIVSAVAFALAKGQLVLVQKFC